MKTRSLEKLSEIKKAFWGEKNKMNKIKKEANNREGAWEDVMLSCSLEAKDDI